MRQSITTENYNNMFAYAFRNGGHPIRTPEQMPAKLNTIPMDAEWLASIADEPWSPNYQGENPFTADEQKMMQLLLSFGGQAVCMPGHEPDANDIVNRGQLWYGDRIMYQRGESNQCHENAAGLWLANRNRTLDGPFRQELALATGYGLSEDGLWRCHSWCVLRTPRTLKIVETTVGRIAYFGYILTREESQKFVENFDLKQKSG